MVPMAELRRIAESLGFERPQSYLQSGNLVFHGAKLQQSEHFREAAEAKLEAALQAAFGFDVPVLVRSAAEWQVFINNMPFTEAAVARPERVLLALAKKPFKPGCDSQIQAFGKEGERAVLVGNGLWLDFPNGSGRSKITPVVLDRIAGSCVTTRNLRTVRALLALLEPAQV
jgi:uncharacterized protein (DUF1697 family)